MSSVNVSRSVREQEKRKLREANFFSQSSEENAQRVQDNVNDMQALKDEVKFIESILLASYGEEI